MNEIGSHPYGVVHCSIEHARTFAWSTQKLAFGLVAAQSALEMHTSSDVWQAKRVLKQPGALSYAAQSKPTSQSEGSVHAAGTQRPMASPHRQMRSLPQSESVVQPS